MGIIFEYTTTGTQQQNVYEERAFPMIIGQARATMNFAGFTTKRCKQLWCEVADTVTMLDNILVHEQDRALPHKIFYDKDAKYAKHLRTFSEMCVTTDMLN